MTDDTLLPFSNISDHVRLAFAAACPEAGLFRRIAITLQPARP